MKARFLKGKNVSLSPIKPWALLAGCGISGTALAADALGIVAQRVLGNLPNSMMLATAAVFFIGFVLVGIAGFMFTRLGRHQGMNGPATVFMILAMFFGGVWMVYHSTFVGVGGATLFNNSGADVTIAGTTVVQ